MLSTVTTTTASSVVSRIPIPKPIDHLRGGAASWLTSPSSTAGGKKSPKATPSSSKRKQAQKSRASNNNNSSTAGFSNRLISDFYKVHEGIRFFISGNVGNVVFFFLERSLYMSLLSISWLPDVVKDYRDGISFFLAYFLQIAVQHLLHAILVYGIDSISTRDKYIATLIACYSTYMVSLFGSTFLNTFLIKRGINRTVSFCTTMFSFACINYFVLKYINEKADAANNNNSRNVAPNKQQRNKVSRGGSSSTSTSGSDWGRLLGLSHLFSSSRKPRRPSQGAATTTAPHHHHEVFGRTTATLQHDVAEECYI
mmetsp:Transcript_32789/g.48566  ORF Transcript_32789/g.48566 Transcript_32789/m.48566 type:complete len:312 (-) Transcript_32789:505-1440(-)